MHAFIKGLSRFALTLCLCISSQNVISARRSNAQTQRKPTIMILGSYHMANPGRDVADMQAEDVLQPKRQREIEELVSLLKRFNPTKIAVEVEPAKNSKLQSDYQKYLSGDYQLKRDEIEQIGFRLAKELKHQKLYAVDWFGAPPGKDEDYDYEAFARKNNLAVALDNFTRKARTSIKPLEEIQRTGTILDIFRYLNSEETINKDHQNYYGLLDFASGEQYVGANWLQYWYGRNLKIFTNIMRVTESPDDRILVIYGAGHLKFLKEFAAESGKYQVEDAAKYLNPKVGPKRAR
jgi:Family of unknown function (DUF5694)